MHHIDIYIIILVWLYILQLTVCQTMLMQVVVGFSELPKLYPHPIIIIETSGQLFSVILNYAMDISRKRKFSNDLTS